jgi:Leucine-rich repeat (LRR) protein
VKTSVLFLQIIVCCLATALAQAASDRDLAEWAIRWEGRVNIEGTRQPIADVALLPPGEIKIVGIDLTGSVMHPAELVKLTGLLSLRELYLPGPIWNPGGSKENLTEAFQALSTLKNVRKLHFGWHYNSQIDITDTEMRQVLALTELTDLRCSQCRLTNINLAPLTKLRSLDVGYSAFSDKALGGLAGLTGLRRLILRDTMVTDEGLKSLAGLTNLEELDLSGTRVTEKGIEFLRGMTQMRELNLLGARATDASMDVLAGMKHLKVANLYRTGITNSGAARLQGLKELTDVDLRYSRVTSNGIEALRAALPNVKVQFVGSAAVAPKSAGAARPAGNTDRAIAAWVKAMGGVSVFAGDRLRKIDLSSTAISDPQLSYLSGLNALEILDLHVTQIGDLGLAALEHLTSLKNSISVKPQFPTPDWPSWLD